MDLLNVCFLRSNLFLLWGCLSLALCVAQKGCQRIEFCGVTPPFEPYPVSKRSFYKSNFKKCRFLDEGGRSSDCAVAALIEVKEEWNKKILENYRERTEVFVLDSGKGICEDSAHRVPTKDVISLEQLISTSNEHYNAFFTAMGEITVPRQMTSEELGRCLRSIKWSSNTISFADCDLPRGRNWHDDELRITVECMGKLIPNALVDTGAGLNIMTLKTARKLGIQDEHISPDIFPVFGYNGSIEYAKGFLDRQVSVGGVSVSQVRIYVMDIESNHNLILGRPFIHSLGAVPSTLHQKLRFPFGGAVVTVHGDRYD